MRVGELKRALEGIDETLEIEVCTKGGPLDGEPDVRARIAKAYVFAELDDEGDELEDRCFQIVVGDTWRYWAVRHG